MTNYIYSSMRELGKILSVFCVSCCFPLAEYSNSKQMQGFFWLLSHHLIKRTLKLSWTQRFLWLLLIWHLWKPLSNGRPTNPIM